MLLSITGASGAGKSSTLHALDRALRARRVTCVEFDSIGVPADADTAWRHGAIERWVQRALIEQRAGRHLVLCGQVPVGELLAAPSADQLDGIAVLLLHCSPKVRRARLTGRGDNLDGIEDHVAFGEWFVQHTRDPTHMPHVIRVNTPVAMRWGRWQHWQTADPRWRFEILDTDPLTRERVADHVARWATDVLSGQAEVLRPGWSAQ
jgi:hypothetical protein